MIFSESFISYNVSGHLLGMIHILNFKIGIFLNKLSLRRILCLKFYPLFLTLISKKFHKSPENWVVGPAGCLMPPTPSVETPRHDAVKLVGAADQEGTSILVSACTFTTLELAIMLNLHLLVLMMGLSLEEEPLFQLNADGYIECYEDLDCPNPIEIEEDNTIIRFSCSGAHTVYSIPSQCTYDK